MCGVLCSEGRGEIVTACRRERRNDLPGGQGGGIRAPQIIENESRMSPQNGPEILENVVQIVPKIWKNHDLGSLRGSWGGLGAILDAKTEKALMGLLIGSVSRPTFPVKT